MVGRVNSLHSFFRAWLDSVMPHRQGPVLGKVESVSSNAQGYVCSVSLVDAAKLEETGEKLENVAINAVCFEGGGQWALPPKRQLVVVGFLELNRAFPFVEGCYTQGVAGPQLEASELLLAGANGAKIKLDAQGLLALKNQNESLKGLLTALIGDVSALKTIPAAPGSPLTLAPDDITKLKAYEARIAMLLAD